MFIFLVSAGTEYRCSANAVTWFLFVYKSSQGVE
jgi:hypothetical protein